MRNSEHLLAAPLLQLLPLPFGNLIGPRAAQWRHKQRAKASARARTEWTKFGHLLLSLGSQPTPPEAALLPFRVNFSTHVSTGTGGSGRRGKRLVSVIEIPLIGGGAHRKSRASVGGSIVECALHLASTITLPLDGVSLSWAEGQVGRRRRRRRVRCHWWAETRAR